MEHETRAGVARETVDFLVLALRTRCDPPAMEELRQCMERGVVWYEVLAAADKSRLGPLLYDILRDEPLAPEAERDWLKNAYRLHLLRNTVILDGLGAVLRAFKAAEIDVIVLKGVALGATVYPAAGLRTIGDIDLLVHRHDVQRIEQLLTSAGFGPLRAETHAGTLADFENEIALRKPGPIPLDVDLHWSLFDSPHYQTAIAMDWFWETAQPAHIAGEDVKVLGLEAEMLHLCGHLWLHHSGTELFWLHDIAELVLRHGSRIDWACLIDRARRFDLVLPLRNTLTRVADDWRAPIPADVMAQVRGLEPSAAEQRVNAWLTSPARPPAQRLWADLVSLPTWSLRLRFLRTNLIPSATYMRERYQIRNPLLLPFYYPYRWYRGVRGLP